MTKCPDCGEDHDVAIDKAKIFVDALRSVFKAHDVEMRLIIAEVSPNHTMVLGDPTLAAFYEALLVNTSTRTD